MFKIFKILKIIRQKCVNVKFHEAVSSNISLSIILQSCKTDFHLYHYKYSIQKYTRINSLTCHLTMKFLTSLFNFIISLILN